MRPPAVPGTGWVHWSNAGVLQTGQWGASDQAPCSCVSAQESMERLARALHVRDAGRLRELRSGGSAHAGEGGPYLRDMAGLYALLCMRPAPQYAHQVSLQRRVQLHAVCPPSPGLAMTMHASPLPLSTPLPSWQSPACQAARKHARDCQPSGPQHAQKAVLPLLLLRSPRPAPRPWCAWRAGAT